MKDRSPRKAPLEDVIEKFAHEYEVSRGENRSRGDWRVRLHMQRKLKVEEVSERDVHVFCRRMGAEYLRRKIPGIGPTTAGRLCLMAEEAMREGVKQ